MVSILIVSIINALYMKTNTYKELYYVEDLKGCINFRFLSIAQLGY